MLSGATGEDGEESWSATPTWPRAAAATCSYSGSVLAESADSGARNLIGRANRYLHWHDIRLFRERGFRLYDFGGLDVDERSPKTAGIARFKRGFGGEVRPVYSTTSARSLRGAAVRRILALRGVDF